MKSFKTFLKSMNIKASHLIAIIGFVVLVYVAFNYSSSKSGAMDSMSNGLPTSRNPSLSNPSGMNPKDVWAAADSGPAQPANPDGQNERFAPVSGIKANAQGLPPSCSAGNVPDPSELLPNDQHNEWARLNPSGSQDFQNINLLKAGYHSGIDTVGSTLRNANLQVRSEPPNPTTKVSPWSNTTIEPDLMRVPLELGCGPQ
jgi:hypothetical protein